VRKGGLEPPRYCYRQPLKTIRLGRMGQPPTHRVSLLCVAPLRRSCAFATLNSSSSAMMSNISGSMTKGFGVAGVRHKSSHIQPYIRIELSRLRPRCTSPKRPAPTGCSSYPRRLPVKPCRPLPAGSAFLRFPQSAHYNCTLRNRSAFPTTDTELKLIAAAAIMGLRRSPNHGYRTPAAIGTPRAL
jgi:hypothetical protein